ncbi:SphA family protein [Pseudoxanthomonas indica]|uniref:Uncharacterized conserved protein n=1 Tax=Pseudoxanthomonas indica TaxID=428993 RepID=A0A1T5JJU4_9GAMM|nr:transporter [Pseudoxanthomonas indica]GGD59108.1 hypothetical protein GCM10007235_34250 [Pseudoxanthomonas indica]SKC51675.1 Uncharacterized conserved protein [Pseudoxanthomonas indica]
MYQATQSLHCTRSHRMGRAASKHWTLGIAAAGLLFASQSNATEGALGRPITGMQITPYAGVIPPAPGLQWSVSYIYYDGEISASRPAPIAGQLGLGLEAEASLSMLTGVYIWPTKAGRWNFASMASLPYIDLGTQVDLQAGPLQRRVNQNTGNLYDFYFAPVLASFHIDQVRHLSFGVYIFAPTGNYDPNRIANAGLNVWTYSPTFAYTQLMQKGTLEFSVQAATDWYSKNDDTNYENGVVFRSEALLIKRTASGWGIGGVVGWIEQLEDDKGPLADRLNGFKGRSLGAGPVITYSKKWKGGEHVDLTFRYVSEFSVKNRFEGDPLSLSVGFGF